MLMIWNKIKQWGAFVASGIIAGFAIALSIFRIRSIKKERNQLRRTLKQQTEYNKTKEEIENETKTKINKLDSDDDSGFNASIELLHNAADDN